MYDHVTQLGVKFPSGILCCWFFEVLMPCCFCFYISRCRTLSGSPRPKSFKKIHFIKSMRQHDIRNGRYERRHRSVDTSPRRIMAAGRSQWAAVWMSEGPHPRPAGPRPMSLWLIHRSVVAWESFPFHTEYIRHLITFWILYAAHTSLDVYIFLKAQWR